MSDNDNPTVQVGETEVEIRETDDGFEAVEVDDSVPDGVNEEVWEKASNYTSSPDGPDVHRLGAGLVLVEDGDGDYWMQYDGEPLKRQSNLEYIHSGRIEPDP